MRRLFVGLVLLWSAFAAIAADDSIAGTHSVVFQPVQVRGELQGCTLVYRAAQFDYAYLEGRPVVAIGNIGIQQFGTQMLFSLKVGLKDLLGNNPMVRPTFAYLQTKSSSTAKVKQESRAGDDGFQLFAYSFFDPSVQKVIEEMTESGRVTLAFNRKKNGMDVLVPIDLDVIDATYPGGNVVQRKRSGETLGAFMGCYLKLIEQAQSSLQKK